MEESGIQRNIVREILRECLPRKLMPNENFVAFYVKLLLLDPNWGITDDCLTSRTNIQKFVEHVIRLLESTSIEVSTIKTQFSYKCYMKKSNEEIDNHKNRLLQCLEPLKMDIIKMVEPSTKDEWDSLRKKIVYYVILFSGLGHPKIQEVFTETLTALRSVMDDNDFKDFVNWPKIQKETHLFHLSGIITGIRLFNKDCGKGGSGIPKLPTLLKSAIESMKELTQKALLYTVSNVNVLTTLIEEVHNLKKDENQWKFEPSIRMPEIWDTKLVDMLMYFRQTELSIRKAIHQMELLEESTKQIHNDFSLVLEKIHKKVEYRIAVSVDIVFPLFEKLANQWTQLQHKVISLTVFQAMMKSFEDITENADFDLMWTSIGNFLSDLKPLSDAERMEHTANVILKSGKEHLHILKPELLANMDQIELEYLGFCPWKFIQTRGGLIPGNPSMGIVQYKTKYYAFSCPEAFNEFSKDPDWYILEILSIARKKPQIINFFELENDMLKVSNKLHLATESEQEKRTSEIGMQTCDNYEDIVSPNKNTSYKWNIWDLKREALVLSKALKKKTTSTQTFKTHSRQTVANQTYDVATTQSQTMKDNYTNLSKPRSYIFGLRGRRGYRHCLVDLTPLYTV